MSGLQPKKMLILNILEILKNHEVHGLVDITGGGLRNILRMNPACKYIIDDPIAPAPLFKKIQELGNITTEEIYQTLNMSMGFDIIAPAEDAEAIANEYSNAFVVGRVEDGKGVSFEPENILYEHY